MDSSSTLHLALPAVHTVASAATPVSTLAQPRAFTTSVNPLVFFSILDHYLRRNAGQDRVIGTLLGVRSEDGTEVEIKGCYPVPHLETQDQVQQTFNITHELYKEQGKKHKSLGRKAQDTVSVFFHIKSAAGSHWGHSMANPCWFSTKDFPTNMNPRSKMDFHTMAGLWT
jgi:hypothetical protein